MADVHRATTAALMFLLVRSPGDASERRAECRRQCVDRVATCVAEGRARHACRREALRSCRRAGLVACPPLDRVQFARDVAASMAEEVTFHRGLCVATLPAVAVSSVEEAVAVGRDVAADLIGIPAATLDARNQCHIPRSCTNVAVKYFVAGTLGAGGPLIPFVKLVAHVARGAAIVYSDTANRTAFAIVGWKDGLAFGIVITGFGGACAQ